MEEALEGLIAGNAERPRGSAEDAVPEGLGFDEAPEDVTARTIDALLT